MKPSNKIKGYLNKVCEQVRWKRSHEIISEEMENHIIDQKNAFIDQGLDEETALDKSILEMGDPIDIGTELDSVYRPKPEWGIIALIGILLVLGVGIRVFARYSNHMPINLTKEIVLSLIAIGTMSLAYLLDYTVLARYSKEVYATLILTTITSIFIYPFNTRIMGQNMYSNYMFLLFPTAFAGIVYNMKSRGYRGVLFSSIYLFIPALLSLAIPSLSSLILCSATCIALLTFAILKGWFNVKKLKALALVYIPTLILGIGTLISLKEYQLERIKYAINPSLDPHGGGYIIITIRNIIRKSKMIGSGLSSRSIKDVVPNINTDFILTNLIHRYGWLALMILIALVFLFIIKSIKVSLNQKGRLGILVSMSIIINFIIQSIFYLINNLGVIYIDSTGFPLISNGGTGLIINMFLIGIMLSVYKSKALSTGEEKLINRSRKNILLSFLENKN